MDIPDRIEIDGGSDLVMTWPDGTVTTVAAPVLRAACQCASCTSAGGAGPVAADVRITSASLVGAYAMNFSFAPDDHHTGIYPYDRLRALGHRVEQA